MRGKTGGLLTLRQSHMARGVAMLMILFVHSINEYPEALQSLWARVLLVPHWGVIGSAVFLLLSGYGMACSMARRPTFSWGYWARKAKGLLLPFGVAFGVTAAALSIYDVKYGGAYSMDLGHLLRLNLSDGNELWFFKTIVAEYVLLMVLDLLRTSPVLRVAVVVVANVAAVATMAAAGWPRYWWASDVFFAAGMVVQAMPPLPFSRQQPRKAGWPAAGLESALAYIGRNSISFYLLEIPVMWVLPSDVLPWPLFFGLTVALTALLAELYRQTFGRM